MDNKLDVCVIGGGAAGLMSAIFASKSGANVAIIEKNQTLGKKITATGNGRCNFTNVDADNVNHYFGSDKRLIKSVLDSFTRDEILTFFDEIGVTPNLEDDGKYFPLSGQATSVSELLERKARQCGATVMPQTTVLSVHPNKDKIVVQTDKGELHYDRCIIAAGGLAAPDTGSDGDGLAVAKKLGHTVNKTFPVIVQMKTDGGFYKRIVGLRIDAGATLFVDGKPIRKEQGDVMFFDYGLSGPPVFKLSVNAGYAIENNSKVEAELDLVPSFDDEKLTSYLAKRFSNSDCSVEDLLVGFINKKLIRQVVEVSKLKSELKGKQFTEKDIHSLVSALKHWRLKIVGTKGYENAQATAGGIPLSELDVDTLRSKKDNRIAFCGEVLDVVGDCGGYNLTWAWASGKKAGSMITK